MARFTLHLQPAKASVAALALLGLALSPGSTLELRNGPSSSSMPQTLMMYPSADEHLVFVDETPEGFDDDKAPLVPQGEGEDLQQPEGPLSTQEEGQEGQQQGTPAGPQEEGQAMQQQAPKRKRAARLRAGLRRAALYIPRQLQEDQQASDFLLLRPH
ncbi:hypothetical protein Esti_006352 [Eimeria stiedai]